MTIVVPNRYTEDRGQRIDWLRAEAHTAEKDLQRLVDLLAAARIRIGHPLARCEHCRTRLPHVLADCDACPEGRAAAERYRRRQAALAGDLDIARETTAKRREDW